MTFFLQTITTAIFMLAREPDRYVPTLRAEVLENSVDGTIDKQTLGKLSKLDSFLRECGRVQPLGLSECTIIHGISLNNNAEP